MKNAIVAMPMAKFVDTVKFDPSHDFETVSENEKVTLDKGQEVMLLRKTRVTGATSPDYHWDAYKLLEPATLIGPGVFRTRPLTENTKRGWLAGNMPVIIMIALLSMVAVSVWVWGGGLNTGVLNTLALIAGLPLFMWGIHAIMNEPKPLTSDLAVLD